MRKWKSFFECLLLGMIIPVFLFVNSVNAEIVKVHPTEGDYHTIADGVAIAAVGDTVLVAPGDYESFTVGKKLTIRSEAGPNTTRIISGSSITFDLNGDGSLITGFTITIPGYSGILVGSAYDYLRIENNIITGCGADGITFHHNVYAVVKNNTICFNNRDGIRLETPTYGVSAVSYALFANNIITNNVGLGINHAAGNIKDISAVYNTIWGNIAGDSSANISADIAHNNQFINPNFIDSNVGAYHLQSTSLCIDAGSIGPVYNDPDGTRNDMGVYGGPGAANFWPYPAGGPVVTELSVTPPSVVSGGTISIKATGTIR